ncbi:MAG TPA: FecR domain-containing protein [Thermoanaerobaculia bacterium]|nr:FecR domain-containing protein [Thermoanaerobaculia bacterium]
MKRVDDADVVDGVDRGERRRGWARRSLGLARTLTFALLVTAPALAQTPPLTVGEVVFVRNQVVGIPPNATASLLALGDDLVLRHRVETGVDSGARLTLGETGNLSLGAKTAITLDEGVLKKAQAGRSRLSVVVGTVRLKLQSLFSGELEVDTPTAVIGIKGTELLIEASAGETVVTVFEGRVTVRGKAGGSVEVRPGEMTVVRSGQIPTQPIRPPRMPEADPADPSPGTPGGTPPATPPAPPAGGGTPPLLPPGGTPPAGKPPTGKPPGEVPPGQRPPSGKPPSETPPGQSPPGQGGPPRITGCEGRGQAGELICVCGSFPDARAAQGLRLDGKRPLEVASVSPGVLQVRLPKPLAAGEHTIEGDARAGFGRGDRCAVDVLTLESEYKDTLKQGRSTWLVLTVEGSRDKLRIRVRNLSPDIIRIRGGADQVVTTRGGRNNTARLKVKAVGDGEARFLLELQDLARCPCGTGATARPGGGG